MNPALSLRGPGPRYPCVNLQTIKKDAHRRAAVGNAAGKPPALSPYPEAPMRAFQSSDTSLAKSRMRGEVLNS